MGKLFGTDGVRGVANVHPMTAETALAIGRATAHVCRRSQGRHKIVIGKDTRLSGYMIENALTAGICSMGVDVLLVGPIPTPAIAFLAHSMRADAGIVISASHNPYQDNGIKIFSRDGYKFSDDVEAQIEDLVSTGRINDVRPTADAVGKAKRLDDVLGRYIVFCKNTFPDECSLEGLRVVLDCANGATYKAAPIIFAELDADVVPIHCSPNGRNINRECGSQYTSDLAAKVVETRANIGLAFDGDGDRLIAVDETGKELTGDHLLAILAAHMKEEGTLRNDHVVVTSMSNLGLRQAFKAHGITSEDAAVGDRNVLELMLKRDAVLGGEQSGHIILHDLHTTGDGIISGLQLLAVMQKTGRKISELAKIMTVCPQQLINVVVKDKPPLADLPQVQDAIKKAEDELGEAGRVVVRYSGTELLCRVMVEGPTAEKTEEIARNIVASLGVLR
jgi:phosphoglucosamine mutase